MALSPLDGKPLHLDSLALPIEPGRADRAPAEFSPADPPRAGHPAAITAEELLGQEAWPSGPAGSRLLECAGTAVPSGADDLDHAAATVVSFLT